MLLDIEAKNQQKSKSGKKQKNTEQGTQKLHKS